MEAFSIAKEKGWDAWMINEMKIAARLGVTAEQQLQVVTYDNLTLPLLHEMLQCCMDGINLDDVLELQSLDEIKAFRFDFILSRASPTQEKTEEDVSKETLPELEEALQEVQEHLINRLDRISEEILHEIDKLQQDIKEEREQISYRKNIDEEVPSISKTGFFNKLRGIKGMKKEKTILDVLADGHFSNEQAAQIQRAYELKLPEDRLMLLANPEYSPDKMAQLIDISLLLSGRKEKQNIEKTPISPSDEEADDIYETDGESFVPDEEANEEYQEVETYEDEEDDDDE